MRYIAVFLILGSVMNVAVATLIQVAADLQIDPLDESIQSGGHGIGETHFPWTVFSVEQRGLRRVVSEWFREIGGGGSGFPSGPPEPLVPAWAAHITPAHHPLRERGARRYLAWEAGWPFPSQGGVLAASRDDWQSPVHVACWWCVPFDAAAAGDTNRYLRDVRLLAFRPVWPGFIVNTFSYAAVIWLLFFAFTVRRMLRRRRGLCAKCAYPIGVSPVCTECGAAVARKEKA